MQGTQPLEPEIARAAASHLVSRLPPHMDGLAGLKRRLKTGHLRDYDLARRESCLNMNVTSEKRRVLDDSADGRDAGPRPLAGDSRRFGTHTDFTDPVHIAEKV